MAVVVVAAAANAAPIKRPFDAAKTTLLFFLHPQPVSIQAFFVKLH